MASRLIPLRTAGIGAIPVLAGVLLAAQAAAQGRVKVAPVFDAAAAPVQEIRAPARATAGNSTDRIVRAVEKKHGAKLMKDPKERVIEGRRVLVLTLIDDKKGRVFEVRVDAVTGKELE